MSGQECPRSDGAAAMRDFPEWPGSVVLTARGRRQAADHGVDRGAGRWEQEMIEIFLPREGRGFAYGTRALGSGGPRTFLSAHFLRFDRHEADKNVRGPSKNAGSAVICECPAREGEVPSAARRWGREQATWLSESVRKDRWLLSPPSPSDTTANTPLCRSCAPDRAFGALRQNAAHSPSRGKN